MLFDWKLLHVYVDDDASVDVLHEDIQGAVAVWPNIEAWDRM